MASQWDISKYLTLYVGEATEHLDALGRDLVSFEKTPSQEVVDSLFRHAHSVKGMAGSMGFEATMVLAHRLEDLLGTVRETPSRFDRELGDLVLAAVDALQSQVKAVAAGQPLGDAAMLVHQLIAAQTRLSANEQTQVKPVAVVAGAPDSGEPPASEADRLLLEATLPPLFSVKLRVSPSSTQPGVRAFLAYKRLSTLGNIFSVEPDVDEMKAGRIPSGQIALELETQSSEGEIARTLRTVAEVSLESVTPAVRKSATARLHKKPPADTAPRPIGAEPARTVRVKTELLDEFLDHAGELMLATARVRDMSRSIPEAVRQPIEESVDRLAGLVRMLHGKVMKARMTPVGIITDRLPRAARDIARKRGREVDLSIDGADIELDRSIVDELNDPILHLLRNAIDHGIEPPEERRMRGKLPKGVVSLKVRRVRDRVEIEMRDDGRGMDVERLKQSAVDRGMITSEQAKGLTDREAHLLACLPAISTATSITDISGRGVGLDAVKRVVDSVGGNLEIESAKGKGTSFRLSLPLTVATAHLLLVSVDGDTYGFPIGKVSGVVQVSRDALTASSGVQMLQFDQSVVAVHELGALLLFQTAAPRPDTVSPLVIVEAENDRFGVWVDSLIGQEEVVLKALARPLDLISGLAGVTVLGNGQPVFILDPSRLERPLVRMADIS